MYSSSAELGLIELGGRSRLLLRLYSGNSGCTGTPLLAKAFPLSTWPKRVPLAAPRCTKASILQAHTHETDRHADATPSTWEPVCNTYCTPAGPAPPPARRPGATNGWAGPRVLHRVRQGQPSEYNGISTLPSRSKYWLAQGSPHINLSSSSPPSSDFLHVDLYRPCS